MYIEIRVQWTINLGSSHMHWMNGQLTIDPTVGGPTLTRPKLRQME